MFFRRSTRMPRIKQKNYRQWLWIRARSVGLIWSINTCLKSGARERNRSVADGKTPRDGQCRTPYGLPEGVDPEEYFSALKELSRPLPEKEPDFLKQARQRGRRTKSAAALKSAKETLRKGSYDAKQKTSRKSEDDEDAEYRPASKVTRSKTARSPSKRKSTSQKVIDNGDGPDDDTDTAMDDNADEALQPPEEMARTRDDHASSSPVGEVGDVEQSRTRPRRIFSRVLSIQAMLNPIENDRQQE